MAPGLLDWVTKNTFSSVRGKGNTPRGVRELLSRGVGGEGRPHKKGEGMPQVQSRGTGPLLSGVPASITQDR